MKTIYQILFVTVLALFAFTVCIHAQNGRDSLYASTMSKALTQLDSARNAQQLQQVKNLFERIAQKYTGEWLPLYYTAYCDVNSVFFDMKSDRNEALLDNATARIEQLRDFPEADLSEINTLSAYCLTAHIALNPKVNGQKYFSEVIGLYEKAMTDNPENPRPVILLSDFEERLPAFIRSGKRNRSDELAKARALFDNEKPNTEKPYWGKYFIR